MPESLVAAQLSLMVGRLLESAARGLDGLSSEELHDTYKGRSNSIAFDVWHVSRTVDNVVHFVFERERPLWLTLGFQEAWGLPRVDQGTGMSQAEAYALRFPESSEVARYVRAVGDAVVPRVAAMDDDYLATINRLVPWGEIPRLQAIGQVLIAHGNGHLGRVDLARSLLGKPGLGF